MSKNGIATGALSISNKIWKEINLSIEIKVNLLRAIVTSTALYGCETWTLNGKLEKRIDAFNMKCFRIIFEISWRDRKSNEFVRGEIQQQHGKIQSFLQKRESFNGLDTLQ